MKSIKKLVLLILVGSLATTYSCNKDETQGKPNLSVTPSKTSAAPGETVDISINTSSAGTVDKLVIEEKTSGSSGRVMLLDSQVKQANFGITYEYTVPQGATGSVDVIVTVTDNLGQVTEVTKTITVTSGSLADCNDVVLGSYDNATGSFFASKTCNVYTVSEAKNSQAAVDFIYYYGTNNNATLAAPDDADVNTISTFQLGSWTTKNATRFKTVTAFDFDGATATTIAAAWAAGGAEMTDANDLANGNMVAFKTADGRYGVVRVNSVNAGAAGTINIDVKSTM